MPLPSLWQSIIARTENALPGNCCLRAGGLDDRAKKVLQSYSASPEGGDSSNAPGTGRKAITRLEMAQGNRLGGAKMSDLRKGQFTLRLPDQVCRELDLLSSTIERLLTRRPGVANELYRMVQPLFSRISTTCRQRELSSAEFTDLLRIAERAQNGIGDKTGQRQVSSSRAQPS